MDKKTFIRELKLALSVLKQEELDDIISEYEQHIDMKQANGLTEEDAIADFGSLNELAAEILEAYHVRADYASGKQKGQKYFPQKEQKSYEPGKIGAVCAKAGAAVTQGAGKAGSWLWGILLFWKAAFGKTVFWIRNRWENPMDYEEDMENGQDKKEDCIKEQKDIETLVLDREEEGEPEAEELSESKRNQFPRRSRRKTGMGRALLDGIRSVSGKVAGLLENVCRLGIRAAFWGLRMVWNSACIGFALFCGGFGLLCLYCMGLLTVLLLQGYPLAGVSLGCAGSVMCSFSAALLSITMVLKGRNRKKAEDREHA